MPDITPPLINQNPQTPNLPPPSGDPDQAEKYVNQLTQLVNNDQLNVIHTDLAKFDPSSLQDHYSLDLKEYRVEVSHSKHPNSGNDSYVILFTNIKKLAEGSTEKIILAYMHIDENQFHSLKKSFNNQIERIRKAEETKRLQEAMIPIDQLLEELSPIKNSENTGHHTNLSSPSLFN